MTSPAFMALVLTVATASTSFAFLSNNTELPLAKGSCTSSDGKYSIQYDEKELRGADGGNEGRTSKMTITEVKTGKSEVAGMSGYSWISGTEYVFLDGYARKVLSIKKSIGNSVQTINANCNSIVTEAAKPSLLTLKKKLTLTLSGTSFVDKISPKFASNTYVMGTLVRSPSEDPTILNARSATCMLSRTSLTAVAGKLADDSKVQISMIQQPGEVLVYGGQSANFWYTLVCTVSIKKDDLLALPEPVNMNRYAETDLIAMITATLPKGMTSFK